MRYIFIDGYNVISSWPELKKLKNSNFEGSRDKLIETIEEYACFNNYKVFLVFDAHLVKGSIENREKINKNLTVVFTKEGQTADSFIEKEVDDIGRLKDVLVVTSDCLEQQTIFQRGATRMSSIEFYYEIKNSQKNIKINTQKNTCKDKVTLSDMVENDILKKLEKIRRND